jgi:hypothetical protein
LLRSMLGRLNCCRSFHIFGRFKLIYFSFYFAVLDPNKRFSASQCLIHHYFTNDPPPTSNENLLLDAPTN